MASVCVLACVYCTVKNANTERTKSWQRFVWPHKQMCTNVFIHTHEPGRDKGEQGTEATAETAKNGWCQFFVCVSYLSLCLYIDMYFIHTDTMTVIKAIYSPILATFLVGGMCVLFPLLKFERTEGGRVNSY